MASSPAPSDKSATLPGVLGGARWLLLAAVVGSIAIAVLLLGFAIALIGKTALALFAQPEVTSAAGKKLALAAIETIDLFLIATVAYVAGVGLYKLFIGGQLPPVLEFGIDDLNQLKEKVIGVLVVALGVLFLGAAMNWDAGQDLLYLGLSTGAVVGALGYFVKH